ncbi:hypothetical protein VIBHAR_05567 [Vibrio campbellii ATCC BAA-1116]|uniref:Uncharacterized protein n=1 Tax=Vibrio campbellii (strain ATCC BAA-1116) TaxID=2902295 RepID=A7N474_VIBC1|nr:hypothetical protein VIBHAR_05567 [Vibrio campbellii ATCC BAA-1116]
MSLQEKKSAADATLESFCCIFGSLVVSELNFSCDILVIHNHAINLDGCPV